MKIVPRVGILLVAVSIAVSCASGHSREGSKEQEVSLAKGKVIPSVSCLRDPSVTYALYLPQSYSASGHLPVIMAFDPHGTGNLPLELYHRFAEKYGYIFLGSNDSRNGLSMDEIGRVTTTLWEEIHNRYSIDTNRIYTMGFSGGSRIASLIALFHGGVAGVIGSGAGFPGNDQSMPVPFSYIGFAGTYDFNMNEMIRLDTRLDQSNCDHTLFLFDGIHDWPPASLMEKGFMWIGCCAMRKQMIPKDEKFLQQVKQSLDSLLTEDKSSGDKLQYYRDLWNTFHFLKRLTETDGYIQTLEAVKNSPEFIAQEKAQKELMDKENAEQQSLTDNFFLRDIGWWKSKIAGYDKRIANTKHHEDVRMYSRIKSFLSLLCYTNYTRMRSTGDTTGADFAYKVYQLVDPENATKTRK